MGLMQEAGAVASVSSYYVQSPTGGPELDVRHPVMPEARSNPGDVGEGPIAASTVMVHRTLISSGFRLRAGFMSAASDLTATGLAPNSDICHVPEPLTVMGRPVSAARTREQPASPDQAENRHASTAAAVGD